MSWLMVALGAGVGAPLRYLVDRAVQSRHDIGFPWGTFTVNIAACAVLGLLTGASTAVPGTLAHLIGPGLCGALSTYSTFSYETVHLARTGAKVLALTNAIVSVVAGLIAAVAGQALTA
ncbi:putative fluoride ion transporter CrcB 2 [Paractinoplanes abujensis]|uniref:Fluoride-specific ion channel FluC n=1 Tax=Paractinoplanes abujensis TaxID=882441 RepID=A0A7W7CPK2_9ACTN|nr:fluoride efflux transporter CrcB [Actinoplanes abujensis]MBB4692400.1 CrcB protein [Actinoplanes abujensis]GID24123.1 putative fluoride ion transporter CrcB 2 [Actinoplanes abujensis]